MNKILVASIVIISAAILTIGGFSIANAVQKQTEATAKAERPSFTYDAAKAPDWYSAGNNWPADYVGMEAYEPEPTIVNMNISAGTPTAPGTCFIMHFYKEGSIDIEAALKAIKDETVGDTEGLSFVEIATHPMSISTTEGVKGYTLHQYEYSGPASASMAKGAQFAYVSLNNGYIEIKGYCEVASDLANTIPAFSSVGFKLNSNN